jgi:hypothetical protein
MRRTAIKSITNGQIAFDRRSMEILAIEQPTKRQMPTGGVIIPITRLKTKINPTWRG